MGRHRSDDSVEAEESPAEESSVEQPEPRKQEPRERQTPVKMAKKPEIRLGEASALLGLRPGTVAGLKIYLGQTAGLPRTREDWAAAVLEYRAAPVGKRK